jgi:hypothetical protein
MSSSSLRRSSIGFHHQALDLLRLGARIGHRDAHAAYRKVRIFLRGMLKNDVSPSAMSIANATSVNW